MSVGSACSAAGGKYLFLIYGLVVLYAFCYQLQLPLEPFLVDKLVGKGDASAVAYGRLQSFFQVVQTIGSFAFGSLLDKYGVRVGLIVNFLATAAQYALLSQSTHLWVLFLSKVPGVAAAGFLCAQTAVSQITPDGAQRVAALGRLTTAYTIGGILGPFVGGRLGAAGDYYTSARVAVFGSLVAAALCCFLPSGFGRDPRSVTAAAAAATTTGEAVAEERRALPPWPRRAQAILSVVGALILAKLVTSTANSMASSAQSLVLKDELGFSEADLGMFMSSQFALGAFANGLLLAPWCRLLGGQVRFVVGNASVAMALAYFALAAVVRHTASQPPLPGGGVVDAGGAGGGVTARMFSFVGFSMALAMFQFCLGTSITAESTQRVPKDMKGTLIGMEHGIFAAARIVTPALGITIFTHAGSSALYASCGTVFFAVFVVWSLWHKKSRARVADEQKQVEIALTG